MQIDNEEDQEDVDRMIMGIIERHMGALRKLGSRPMRTITIEVEPGWGSQIVIAQKALACKAKERILGPGLSCREFPREPNEYALKVFNHHFRLSQQSESADIFCWHFDRIRPSEYRYFGTHPERFTYEELIEMEKVKSMLIESGDYESVSVALQVVFSVKST